MWLKPNTYLTWSNLPKVRRGKVWQGVAGNQTTQCICGRHRRRRKPIVGTSHQGSPPFSLTKPVRLPSSLAHCRDMGSCRLLPPSSRLSYVPQVQLPLQSACTTAPAAHITPCIYFSTSLPRTYLYWLLRTVFVMSLCLIN